MRKPKWQIARDKEREIQVEIARLKKERDEAFDLYDRNRRLAVKLDEQIQKLDRQAAKLRGEEM
jgi:hypothetical protein